MGNELIEVVNKASKELMNEEEIAKYYYDTYFKEGFCVLNANKVLHDRAKDIIINNTVDLEKIFGSNFDEDNTHFLFLVKASLNSIFDANCVVKLFDKLIQNNSENRIVYC